MFNSFQSCSTDINHAAEYMNGISNAVFEIELPSNWMNGFYIYKKGDEYSQNKNFTILPYTNFTVTGTSFYFNFLRINSYNLSFIYF